jgi:hypothetical protein
MTYPAEAPDGLMNASFIEQHSSRLSNQTLTQQSPSSNHSNLILHYGDQIFFVSGGIVECALAYKPGDSGFESHFSREFSGGTWIIPHTEAANQE